MCRAISHNFFLAAFFLVLFAGLAHGQINPASQNTDKNNQTKADESFTLDISESRVVEAVYERSMKVEIGDAQNGKGVSVRVGASVRGENITITLRGITGNVRFRASLERLQRLLERDAEMTSGR